MYADIMLLLRRLVHEGTPLDTVATAVLKDISLRSSELDNLNEAQKEWICRLLKLGNAFETGLAVETFCTAGIVSILAA
jgi:hypothetical protein